MRPCDIDNHKLQEACEARIKVARLKQIASVNDFDASLQEFDDWHRGIIQDNCWRHFTVRNIEQVRWGHFAKLVNIIIYEFVANNEIMTDEEARRLRSLIHLPIDKKVLDAVRTLVPDAELPRTLLDMNEKEYTHIQWTIRDAARRAEDAASKVVGVPAIWFEDAYSWVAEAIKEKVGGEKKSTGTVFGHPVTTAIRAMTKAGLSKEEITKVLDKYGMSVNPSTLSTQMGNSRRGAGVSPDLPEEHKATITGIIGRHISR